MSDSSYTARRTARGTVTARRAALRHSAFDPSINQPTRSRSLRPFLLGASALLTAGGIWAGLTVAGWNLVAPASSPALNRLAGHVDKAGHCYVNGLIDGEMFTLMVDSGASAVVFSRKLLPRLGVDTKALRFNKTVRTAAGSVRAAAFTLHEVRLGGFVLHDVAAFAVEAQGPAADDPPLLGMSVLNAMRLEVGNGACALLWP
jgi:clan AA aspartic protease (TIGR02281 family)